jgi:hypothetical protein
VITTEQAAEMIELLTAIRDELQRPRLASEAVARTAAEAWQKTVTGVEATAAAQVADARQAPLAPRFRAFGIP